MVFGRETVWDEPARLEGGKTVLMYERFRERQVGLGVCTLEPGRAAIATNGEPVVAESLSSDEFQDMARHRSNAYEAK